jgi:hypothetical protein
MLVLIHTRYASLAGVVLGQLRAARTLLPLNQTRD